MLVANGQGLIEVSSPIRNAERAGRL